MPETYGDRIRKMTDNQLTELFFTRICSYCKHMGTSCSGQKCEDGIRERLGTEVGK